ncbi:hypothetical protein EB75_04335 [Mycobacterium sp. ST-F2]|uniref:hypothetical protein n=1 Tax=Mycobacterium sp. ST-F2 TaxID=1490484 RepID=UPI00093EF12E|nr:hypothetical protein [Mycobacterium sp. ST-F2]OKH84544.1 hypothetical protein EB75_04335 [Mycobacterium sp. ST-F2]
MAKPIWIIDDITVNPGQGPAFVDAYMKQYVPGAIKRGMTLANRMVMPCEWLVDGEPNPNRILFVWTVPDALGVWGFKFAGRNDPAVLSWWRDKAPKLCKSRSRMILADVDDLAGLANV